MNIGLKWGSAGLQSLLLIQCHCSRVPYPRSFQAPQLTQIDVYSMA
jgi:hypothetical protein